MNLMFESLDLPFVQRGLVEIALLSVGAGLVGTWIVLRGQAFFAHAVGAAAFPGLVLAAGLGFAPLLGAFGAAILVAGGVALLERDGRAGHDAATALVLVAALAIGVILASDVFESPASVEQLLFGSLLLIDSTDQAVAAGLSVAALILSGLLGRRWLATGFDSGQRTTDLVLLAMIAGASVAVLHAMGALLAGALLVIPAATTRLLFDRMRRWQMGTVALVLLEGWAGLMLSVELNAPPGATIAVLAGAVFVFVAAGRALLRSPASRPVLAAVAAVALLGLAGCGSDSGGDKPKVVASTTIVADITRQLAGDDFEVDQLLQPNSDPHDYEPRPDDVKSIAEANLVLSSGLGLDEFVDEAVDSSGTGAELVEVGEAVQRPLESGDEHAEEAHDHEEHDHGAVDPHWWQNPLNAIAVTQAIARELARISPADAASVKRRAASYISELRRLDRQIAGCISAIPTGERKMVTSHDAFGYYADRYGLEVVGTVIPSTSTQAQPNSGELARLSRTIRAEDVKAVFPEEALNPRVARAIADQTGARADLELYGDALGPADSPAATYTELLKTNTTRISEGLTGTDAGCNIR